MKNLSFSAIATSFIEKIVKQRIQLAKMGRSKNSSAEEDAIFIGTHLRAYPRRTDDQMAGFWMRNHDRIFNIIPGVRSGSAETLVEEFHLLHSRANILFRNHLITPKIKINVHSHN